MASIRERIKKPKAGEKDGQKVFHVQVRMTGYPARTASFPTKRAAERWATTVEAEMIEGKHFRSVEARRRTLGEAIDKYLSEEVGELKDGGMHRSRLPWWKKHAGDVKLAELSPSLINSLRGKLRAEPFMRANPKSKRTTVKPGDRPREFKRSNKTVDGYLAVLSTVCTYARKEWQWMSHNPFDGVKRLKLGDGSTRHLSADERDALLKQTAADPTLHTFVVLALSTACRAGELLKLTWRDVDLREGKLDIRGPKNTVTRSAWLHGEALRLLTEHARVRPIDDDVRVFLSEKGKKYDYRTPWLKAVAAAKITNFRFHDLRHSAATYLAREGATESQLRAIGGWKSGVVRKYVHIAAQDAKDVVAKMNKKILGDS